MKFRLRLERQDADTVRITGKVGGHDVGGTMPVAAARQLGANIINVTDDVDSVSFSGSVEIEIDGDT